MEQLHLSITQARVELMIHGLIQMRNGLVSLFTAIQIVMVT